MDKAEREALEAAGFQIGDFGDFLELTPEERQLVELRLRVSRMIRQRRQEQNLTQQQVAKRIKSSQSRVAKIEAGAPDVSLDLMFSGLFAVGGAVTDLAPPAAKKRVTRRSAR
jgi:DNA-binding XRE family transcriptional regulator